MKKIIKTLAVLSLVFGFAFVLRANDGQGFIVDTVSAATDGSGCGQEGFTAQDMKDVGWPCSVEWLSKGYVYDEAKQGYFPGGSAPVTTTPAVTTTTPAATTPAATTTTTKTTPVNGSTTTTTPAATDAPEVTTTPVEGEGDETPEVTTTTPVVTTTTPAATTPATTTTTAPADKNDDANIPLLAGLILIIAVIGFFVFKKFGNKE